VAHLFILELCCTAGVSLSAIRRACAARRLGASGSEWLRRSGKVTLPNVLDNQQVAEMSPASPYWALGRSGLDVTLIPTVACSQMGP